jgi:hypothetical protein
MKLYVENPTMEGAPVDEWLQSLPYITLQN